MKHGVDSIGLLKAAAKALNRHRRPLVFGDTARTAPVSSAFGWERGLPIDRYYVQKFLSGHRAVLTGVGLEIAEPKYLVMYGDRLSQRQVLVPEASIARTGPAVDGVIVADLSRPETVPAGVADCFICTQTLNVVYDFKAALASARKLLRPGGVLLGTAPGISQISRYDEDRWGDYWRFTPRALTRVLGEIFDGPITVASYGNALAAQALMQGLAVEDLPDRATLDVNDPDYPLIVGFCARVDTSA